MHSLELESYQLASRQKPRFVKEIQLERELPVQSVTTSKGTVDPGDVLQQLVAALEHCCKDSKAPASSKKERTQTGRNNLVCWKCKQTGYGRAECPQLLEKRSTQQSDNRASQPGKREVAKLAGQSSVDTIVAPTQIFDFKTGSIYGNSGSLIITGTINGKPCDMTIDTGSDISIVREDVLSEDTWEQIQSAQEWLRTATGEREPLRGVSQLQLGIGSQELPETSWVAGIHDQCILLGLDFL